MARPRQAAKAPAKSQAKLKLTADQIAYLGGVFDSTFGLRGLNTIVAIVIDKDRAFADALVKTYGGTTAQFTSGRGRNYWGWYLSHAERMEYVELFMSHPSAIKSMDKAGLDRLAEKLRGAIDKEPTA